MQQAIADRLNVKVSQVKILDQVPYRTLDGLSAKSVKARVRDVILDVTVYRGKVLGWRLK